METVSAIEATVSADGKCITFVAVTHGRPIHCLIERDALEQWFWVPSGATEERLIKAFLDGRQRIFAVAERKWRARQSDTVRLGVSDFSV
jgi:Protein of unknown function (DUF1488)